ncbi:MAG: hypothetical protein LQ343_007813 [Gyalolechia ehrenbergii]|nr:MAG: hypothetical protein LQ343_007813 [Gyalolechia ehrenbergii]
MSLKIKHLNGDTTFLLTFSPAEQRPPSNRYGRPPGTFSVLIDPWLSGPSTMWHPRFLLSKHTVPSCISNLSHIPEPNVVLVSQDKPDHCHEPTLRQLDPTSTLTNILAVSTAAKKIRGMKHFHPDRVHALPAYSSKDHNSLIRFYIPPLSPGGAPGEATIAYIPAKMDMSGLHNAIGITYRPPTAAPLPTSYPPLTEPSTYSNFSSPNVYRQTFNSTPTPPDSPDSTQRPRSLSNSTDPSTRSTVSSSSVPLSQASSATTAPSTSLRFTRPSTSHTSHPSVSSTNSTHHLPRPAKTLSLIYSPHGLAYSPHLIPYATHHLVRHAALPLSALIHGFDRVENPWYMGGNVNAGIPGGIEIAKSLMARHWIGAHDEEKENSGLAVMKVRMKKFGLGEVRELVRREFCGGGGGCDVRVLDCGEELVVRS